MRSIILVAVAKLLRPLVRVLLKYQISYGEIASVMRRTYVEVADADFTIPQKKSTYSKVAVMTGIDRKMVQEILNQKKDNPDIPKAPINKGLSVVKTWLTTPKYLDKNKKAKDLPLRGPLSFESLVKKACADFSPRSLLDELIRVGVVEKVNRDTVRLIKDDYVPSKDEQLLVDILLTSVKDLLVTGEHNLTSPEDLAWFQREVQYSRLPESVVNEFKKYSNKKSQLLISDLNRWLNRKKATAKQTTAEETRRVGLGVYYIETDNDGV